jgi:hypothetical protein
MQEEGKTNLSSVSASEGKTIRNTIQLSQKLTIMEVKEMAPNCNSNTYRSQTKAPEGPTGYVPWFDLICDMARLVVWVDAEICEIGVRVSFQLDVTDTKVSLN